MTDNLLGDMNLNWDDEVGQIDETGPVTITDYGSMQLIAVKKVQMFAKDSKVALSGFSLDGIKPYERGGMKDGHAPGGKNATAYFVAFFGKAFTDDKDFTAMRIFTTLNNIPMEADKVDGYPVIALTDSQKTAKEAGKTVWLSDWSNLQFPAFRQLPADVRQKFQEGKRIFFKADNWNTGAKPNEDTTGKVDKDGNPKKYYNHYWYNFTIFANEEEMLKARSLAKRETASSNGNGVDMSNYPVTWAEVEDKASLYSLIKDSVGSMTPLEVAKMASLLTPDGKPVKIAGSEEKVDLAALFSKACDQPAEMFTF